MHLLCTILFPLILPLLLFLHFRDFRFTLIGALILIGVASCTFSSAHAAVPVEPSDQQIAAKLDRMHSAYVQIRKNLLDARNSCLRDAHGIADRRECHEIYREDIRDVNADERREEGEIRRGKP